jgi:ribosomal protein L7/L12
MDCLSSAVTRDAAEVARNLYADLRDWDAVLAALRGAGFSVVDAIKATRVVKRVSFREAKELVHTSAAWQDRRPDFDALHDDIVAAVCALRDSNGCGE